jgi:hypothetical protein
MKSAFELAMERLEKSDGKTAALTDAQKSAIAEVESKAKAKTAEIEIMFRQKHLAVLATHDPAQIQEVERQRRSELEKIHSQTEEQKERIRRG